MRKRKDFKRREGVKSARLVVIAAEGRNTENIYFESMKVSLCASDVHVEVLHRDSNESSPENVYEQIRKFMCKHSKKCTFYTLRFGCSFAAVNTIKPQLL